MRRSGFAFVFASHSLADLLAQARDALRKGGSRHTTQRGITRSLNAVALTWKAPQTRDEHELFWTPQQVTWYLRAFVARRPANDPLGGPPPHALLFPYTYAARTRYWDGGWASLHRLVHGLRQHDIALARATVAKSYFIAMVELLAEELHLQTVLSLLAL